ncbi:lipopolysaccharide biosynthesis protein [Ornithinimicrobium sp. LYQ92]|uniref:lipopolysaccharide biosynthesis protein n=1 Tax=Serinicoccus sp. LYQ92 TaxID=3378798 RepID=UPI00385539F5
MTGPPHAAGPDGPQEETAAVTPQPSLAGRLIRGSSWRILAQIMPLFVNLALTPFVITTLGRTGYGLWLVTSTVTQLIATFDGGIGRSAQYYFALHAGTDDRRSITRLLVTLSVAAIAVSGLFLVPAFILAADIARFFQAPPELLDDTTFLLRVLLVLVAAGLLRNLFAAALHAYERFAISSVSSLLSYAVYAAGMLWVLSAGMGLRGVAYAFIAQQVVATLTIVPPSLRHLSWRGVGFVSWARLLEVGKVSWRVQVSGLLTIASMQGVLLIVGRLRPGQVPDFGPGNTFAQQLRLIPMNGVAPIQAMLGRSVGSIGPAAAAPEMTHVQRIWVRAVTGWVVVGAPAAYVGVNVWLPLEGELAGQVAAIMLVAQWLALLPQVLLQWLLLLGRAQYEMWSSALTVLLLAVVSLILVPQVGAIGAAVGAVVGQFGGLMLLLWISRRLEVPVPSAWSAVPWWQAVVAGSCSAAAVWVMQMLIQDGPLPSGGLGLLLCGAAAGPALLLFVVLTWGPGTVQRFLRSRLR